MSWTYEVKVVNEDKWYGVNMRFATEEEARSAGQAKFSSWTMCTDYRVVEVDFPANYRWQEGAIELPILPIPPVGREET